MMFKTTRRSGRLFKSLPILPIGSDCEGRVFSEATHTVVLSLHGAGVVSSFKLIAEQELILRLVESNREAEIRIVGEIGSQDGRHAFGVAFIDEDLDFWRMNFPMPPSPRERPLELVLECNGCGSAATLANGDYEFDVRAIHGGLVRYCSLGCPYGSWTPKRKTMAYLECTSTRTFASAFALFTVCFINLKVTTKRGAGLEYLQTSLMGEFPLPRAGRILFSIGKSPHSQHYHLRRENRCGG